MKILLTGALGNLGQQLLTVFEAAGHTVISTDRARLDITDEGSVERAVAELAPDAIVNAAAYNQVDQAEDPEEYKTAYAINALGPKYLAATAKRDGIPLVHFSTDYVFAGNKEEGYVEKDATDPISQYGVSKAAGERFVLESGAKAYICRTSKLFGPQGTPGVSKPGFVDIMLALAATKPELRVVAEEVGMPTYTVDVAETVLWMLERDIEPGVYHIVNEGLGVMWYEFAEEIFSIVPSATPRIAVSSDEFPRPAHRPKFAALINTKLPKLRSRSEALADYLNQRSN